MYVTTRSLRLVALLSVPTLVIFVAVQVWAGVWKHQIEHSVCSELGRAGLQGQNCPHVSGGAFTNPFRAGARGRAGGTSAGGSAAGPGQGTPSAKEIKARVCRTLAQSGIRGTGCPALH